jgi:hypothetical protein
MNDAFARDAVKRADRIANRRRGHVHITGADCDLSLFDIGASRCAIRAIAQSLLLGDANPLLGCFIIRQVGSPLESRSKLKAMQNHGFFAATD